MENSLFAGSLNCVTYLKKKFPTSCNSLVSRERNIGWELTQNLSYFPQPGVANEDVDFFGLVVNKADMKK
jgi:hypothetical protein